MLCWRAMVETCSNNSNDTLVNVVMQYLLCKMSEQPNLSTTSHTAVGRQVITEVATAAHYCLAPVRHCCTPQVQRPAKPLFTNRSGIMDPPPPPTTSQQQWQAGVCHPGHASIVHIHPPLQLLSLCHPRQHSPWVKCT